MRTRETRLYLPDVVGKGYGTYWNFKGRYRVCKGSRASKKSKTTALNMIVRIMQYPEANALVVRRVFRTIKDSCFTELKWAINRLQVAHKWEVKQSPLEMTYKPTGQKIYFRGMDDPLKTTSITSENGHLCFLWVEEAYEIEKEEDFNTLEESIRGAISSRGLFKQVTLTFNPWSEDHWLKSRFFDVESDQVLTMTTNYLCNEWLDDADRMFFETMKEQRPERYKVAGLGEWGIVGERIFQNVTLRAITADERKGFDRCYRGVDWGYYPDPWAYNKCYYQAAQRRLFITDELTMYRASNRASADALFAAGVTGADLITADSAEPKSIADYKAYGLLCRRAIKGQGSVEYGTEWLMGLQEIVIDPATCPDTAREFTHYQSERNARGEVISGFPDADNHHIDAVRYALESVWKRRGQ